MGYYLGLSKIAITNNRKDLRNKNLVLSVLVPTLTHGVYDYCLMTENVVFIILFIIFVIFVYVRAFRKINKVSSINKKFKYKNNFCPNCGHVVNDDFCPMCGSKNE